MNYWLLTTEYPPFHGGGISTYCRFTAEMLAGAGYGVTVFVPDDSVTDYEVSGDEGIILVRFNSNRNQLHEALGYAARLSYAFADLVRLFIEKQGKPDYIEAQDYLGIAYYLTQFKQTGYPFLEHIPILVTLHSPAFIYLEYNRVPTYRFPDFWTGEMEKQSIAAADVLISPTRFLVEEIGRYMDMGERAVHVIANPYRREGSASIPAVKTGKIVYYGKLSPQKGSFELLAYFKALWDEGFAHPLHIIGGTDIVYHPEGRTMGQLVEKKYGDYIQRGLLRLHGKIRPEQIPEYLHDAHVVIVPSIVDNLPYVVMEAMSLGKVVLASVQGGQREMMEDGVSGFLFDHRDPGSFGAQLVKILALDNTALEEIGRNAVRWVEEHYSFERVWEKKMDLLAELGSDEREAFPFLHEEVGAERPALPEGLNTHLTVVVPYYNMGAYIEDCLRSVLASTYQDLDVLVIDDGSTDPASLQRLQTVSAWERVRVVHQPNQGLARTRNAGAAQAGGTYLAFLDADDKVDPTYYEKAIRALQRNGNVYFVGAWVKYFENSTQLYPTFTPQPPYALVHNPVNSSGLVYKRAAFLAGGLNDPLTDYGIEDYESVVSMLHGGWNGVVLPEVLFHYRVRTGSMFRAVTREKLVYSNKYIVEKHAAYYAKFAASVINLLNANGPGYLFDNPTLEVTVTSKTARGNIFILKLKSFIKRNERLKRIALAVKKHKS